MKATTLFISSLILLIASACSSTQNTAPISSYTSKSDLTGTWVISDIKLEGFPADYQIGTAFNIAPYESLVGSTWRLYSSYKGEITLTDGSSTNIYWDLINNGGKPMF